MKRLGLLAMIACAACGAGKAGDFPDATSAGDANSSPDAPSACTTSVTFTPEQPVAVAGATVVANGEAHNPAHAPVYTWVVTHNNLPVTLTKVDQFGASMQWSVEDPGPYVVHFQAGEPFECQGYDTTLNVPLPGAKTQSYRLRVIPLAGTPAPPQEIAIQVVGGAENAMGSLALQAGQAVSGVVQDAAGAPVPAYVRFESLAMPDVAVESFAAADGAFQALLWSGKHDVLIVPESLTKAPARIAGWQSFTTTLVVPDADSIGGTVLAPNGTGLAGARVALNLGGVPTTVATTDGNGAWTALGHVGGAVDLAVVPPDSSGLPRLSIKGATLDASQPIKIGYAPSLATVDVAGTIVRASGTAAPGARVTFTGAIASAATITAGVKNVTAAGAVQLVAHADGTGALLAQKVPRAPLVATVEPSPTIDAVVAVDTTGGKPAAIDAPAQVAISGLVTDSHDLARAKVRVRLVPIGPLAAGTLLEPATITGADGRFSLLGAPGGHYALEAIDLAQGYSEVDRADVTAGDLGTLKLGDAIALTGVIRITSPNQLVKGAALSVLCASCAGIDRSRAVARAVTEDDGTFRLTVPDPGTSAQ